MNKKLKIALIVIVILLVLVIPIKSTKDDGGTVVYNSLTYKIIDWHEENITYEEGYKTGRDVYFFPKNFKSVEYYSDQDAGERERNFGIARVIDKSEKCAIGAEKEMFYKIDNLEYYFPCNKSMFIEVIFNDGSTMVLPDALLSEKMKISDLRIYGIEYEEVDINAEDTLNTPLDPYADYHEE